MNISSLLQSLNVHGIMNISSLLQSWNVHGIMKTSDLLQSKWSSTGFTLTLQETQSIHDSMNIPKIEFIAYIYILLYISKMYYKKLI